MIYASKPGFRAVPTGWHLLALPLILALLISSTGCLRRQARRSAPAATALPTPAASAPAPTVALPAAPTANPTARPETPAGAYQSPQRYAVKVFSGYVVHDADRQRDLPIKLRYPAGAEGPLPWAATVEARNCSLTLVQPGWLSWTPTCAASTRR